MSDYADLEISLRRCDEETYEVEMRFTHAHSDADIRLLDGRAAQVRFDQAGLLGLMLKPEAYGRLLTDNLFAHTDVRTAFGMVRSSVQASDSRLRLRLLFAPDAAALHSLRWETLRDPFNPDQILATHDSFLLSRYLVSQDWRPVKLRTQDELRALVVIANPSNLSKFQLAVVDTAGELERARTALGTIPVDTLVQSGQANIGHIIATLRQGYDILYLVCHGSYKEGKGGEESDTWLWLENEAGEVERVPGSQLVQRLNELAERPRLIVLASCQTAGDGRTADEAGVLAALGPRLAQAGIPAVIAMQGSITMETVARFMPTFFSELIQHGEIDRAMAVARSQVQTRPDWWMPVLYLRLKSGKIGWYTTGFTSDDQLRVWQGLIQSVRDGQCTPVLGVGLLETLFGSPNDMARRWAEKHHFPLALENKDDLTQVAQFLAIDQGESFPRSSLVQYMCQEVRGRNLNDLSADWQTLNFEEMSRSKLLKALNSMMLESWQKLAQRDATEPYQVLASLPLPVYITTDPSDLLYHALVAQGKEPRQELCPWNQFTEEMVTMTPTDRYEPDEDQPLVYHLFGRLQEPESLVLTEDDYFDYLIGVTRNKDLIPKIVRSRLTRSSLLFLGFHFEDWAFRAFFRSLINQEGGDLRKRYIHVAGQIAPDENQVLNPEGAKAYLKNYFAKGASVDVFWGTARDFIRAYQQQKQGR
jgi:hypothetical protein